MSGYYIGYEKLNNKGMTTIEACIIIPITLIVTMMLIWLGLFFYNKSIMSVAASRAGIMGGQHPEKSNDELVEYVTKNVEDILQDRLIFMEDPSVEVTVNYMDIVVHLTGDMRLPESVGMGGIYKIKMWEIDMTEKSARLQPSIFVRTLSRVRNGISENKAEETTAEQGE